jgi:hypothetical protein
MYFYVTHTVATFNFLEFIFTGCCAVLLLIIIYAESYFSSVQLFFMGPIRADR